MGKVNEDGELTGDEAIAYIYPDLVTSLVGQFREGVFVRGVRARLTAVKQHYSWIKVPQFELEEGQVYEREVSTCDFMTNSPMLMDPYEVQWVEVRQSMVEGGEEGLFSRKDVKAGTVGRSRLCVLMLNSDSLQVLAFYNGIRRKKPENSSSSWQLEENAYKIFDPTNKGGVVDIPQHLRSLGSYRARYFSIFLLISILILTYY